MTDILVTDFVTGILIYLRIAGMLFTAPVFSNSTLPNLAKLLIALLLTYIIFFTVGSYDYNVEQGLLPLILVGIKELIIGMLMGITLNFVFYGMSFAGFLIGRDMGLAMATMFDPASETQTNVMGQFLSITAFLVFLIINGHHYIVTSLTYSFKIIPIGFNPINEEVYRLLIRFSAGIFVLAVKIASPIMVSFFLVHLAAGIIARVVPQMQVFFVMLPLKMGLGFFLLMLVTPLYVYMIKNLLESYESKLLQLIKAMSI